MVEIGRALLVAGLTLLGKASFWYCVVALTCAAIVAGGLRSIAREAFSLRVALRPHVADDDIDYELFEDNRPGLDQEVAEYRTREKEKAKR